MTDDGSLFDDDGEWVTGDPDDEKAQKAADQLERATNLARTSDSDVFDSPERVGDVVDRVVELRDRGATLPPTARR